jgi:hypothetical protein
MVCGRPGPEVHSSDERAASEPAQARAIYVADPPARVGRQSRLGVILCPFLDQHPC